MKRRVIVDTGPLVALLSTNDRWHAWAREQFAEIEPPLLTCEAVVSETCFLVQRSGGDPALVLRQFPSGLLAIPFTLASEVETIVNLMSKYADVPMSFADACLVAMAQEFPKSPVMTLDSDFQIYRKTKRNPIALISPH